MKIFSVFLCLLLSLSFSVTSFAVDLDAIASEIPADEGVAEEVTTNVEEESSIPETEAPVQEEPETLPDQEAEVEEINPDLGIYDDTITNISIRSVAPIEPGDTSGLKSVLLGVLGNYDPVVVEFEVQGSEGSPTYIHEVMPDMVWIASFLIFSLFIYCLFRLGGAFIG